VLASLPPATAAGEGAKRGLRITVLDKETGAIAQRAEAEPW
jgi:hypothetical protein